MLFVFKAVNLLVCRFTFSHFYTRCVHQHMCTMLWNCSSDKIIYILLLLRCKSSVWCILNVCSQTFVFRMNDIFRRTETDTDSHKLIELLLVYLACPIRCTNLIYLQFAIFLFDLFFFVAFAQNDFHSLCIKKFKIRACCWVDCRLYTTPGSLYLYRLLTLSSFRKFSFNQFS